MLANARPAALLSVCWRAPPCKPDSVRPGGLDGHSFNPAEPGARLRRDATITRGQRTVQSFPSPVLHHGMGLPCRPGCPNGGGLLPHHFTLPVPLRAIGGMFPVALSVRVPRGSRPPLVRRAALWCPDFLNPACAETATVRGAARAIWRDRLGFPSKTLKNHFPAGADGKRVDREGGTGGGGEADLVEWEVGADGCGGDGRESGKPP